MCSTAFYIQLALCYLLAVTDIKFCSDSPEVNINVINATEFVL